MIYTLHIYDPRGICLYYREWHKPQKSILSTKEEQALVYGLVFSIKTTFSRLTSEEQMSFSYKTDAYRLHYYETPTRLKWVLMTGFNVKSHVLMYYNNYTRKFMYLT